ncbi:MAG: KamA family radical SAM protein [Bacilli bacterium]
MKEDKSKKISIKRAEELENSIAKYTEMKSKILTGYDIYETRMKIKTKILKLYNASNEDWNSWEWQLRNSINTVDELNKIIDLTMEDIEVIDKVGKNFRWSITPYYVSLISVDDKECPIRLQALPSILELDESGKADPMAEEFTSPVDGITRRYPDRLIINVTNSCGMYCRHCQRRRNIGTTDVVRSKESLQECIDYIRKNSEIRDVLLTGGDALCVSDDYLEWLLSKLREIPSVEIIRIGSRTPVVMPQRITKSLCKMLAKYAPIYLNTHFNSPREVSEESKRACELLSNHGIILGNQSVLLHKINDNEMILKKLNQELLKIRVRPYYIFHPKDVIGTRHFNVSIKKGIEIMSKLRGKTSGLAIPTYIVNAPYGMGKIPLQKETILNLSDDSATLITWEGKEVVIK